MGIKISAMTAASAAALTDVFPIVKSGTNYKLTLQKIKDLFDGYYGASGWALTGNSGTVPGIDFIGTSDAVDFVIKTNNSEVARFSAAGNFGLGVSPLYRYHVKAATSMTGGIMSYFQNAANTAYMAVYDDGNCYLNSPQYTGWALQVAGTNVTQIVTTSSVRAKQRIPTDYTFNRVTDDFCLFGQSSGNWFFQNPSAIIFTPSARVHIQGETSDNTTYGIKIEKSDGSLMLSLRNDSLLSLPLIQIGNTGLASGDIYFDTAANILANNDLIAARKV